MNWNCDGSQFSGFQTGIGLRKTGSSVPNAMARTTYSGSRKKSASQTIPGVANAGQSQRG